jgi:hypothetical protein
MRDPVIVFSLSPLAFTLYSFLEETTKEFTVYGAGHCSTPGPMFLQGVEVFAYIMQNVAVFIGILPNRCAETKSNYYILSRIVCGLYPVRSHKT